MIKADKYYLSNIKKIQKTGSWDEKPRPKYLDGTPAYSKFITGVFEEYNIAKDEFPITTLRPTAIKTGIKEILWIYQKQSNLLSDAHNLGINWWDEFDIGDGTIGQRYGATIKSHNLMDDFLKRLKEDPFSRRHILNMYQYGDLESSPGLFPCAYETLWSVRKDHKNEYILDLTLVQRSNDYIMAGYINKIQYVALQMMVAGHCGYKIGMFKHLTQNLHIYDRHFEGVNELLNRTPVDIQPILTLKENKFFFDYTVDDFEISDVSWIKPLSQKLEIAI